MPNRFTNSSKVLTTSFQELIRCPEDHQMSIHSLFFTNTNTENEDRFVTLSVQDGALDNEVLLGKNLPIPANATLSFDKAVNLKEGDILKARSDRDIEVHAFASILLITPIDI